jgi:acetyl-CoA carboxylase biotin carboxyl carrier protein
VAPATEAAPRAAAAEAAPAPPRLTIAAPMVGTFYRAPAPGAEPFIKIGDRVGVGQTLCIIEAMKVMNEIEAEFPGLIKEILVENGSPVEAEAILFLIDPD